MPVLRASISERDGTSLFAGTAKRWCDIDAHYLRLPSHPSDYPSFSIVTGLCTGRFAKSLAASAERSHGLRTVDLHVTVFKSWCGRGILKRSHWRIWLHAIVGKQVRLLGHRSFCPTPKPIASGATLRRIVSRMPRERPDWHGSAAQSGSRNILFGIVRRCEGEFGVLWQRSRPLPASSTRCGCAIPRQVLELHHDAGHAARWL
jgi:hypothetical protein